MYLIHQNIIALIPGSLNFGFLHFMFFWLSYMSQSLVETKYYWCYFSEWLKIESIGWSDYFLQNEHIWVLGRDGDLRQRVGSPWLTGESGWNQSGGADGSKTESWRISTFVELMKGSQWRSLRRTSGEMRVEQEQKCTVTKNKSRRGVFSENLFYWSGVGLWLCVNFCYTEKWFGCRLFFTFHCGLSLNIVPCAIQ